MKVIMGDSTIDNSWEVHVCSKELKVTSGLNSVLAFKLFKFCVGFIASLSEPCLFDLSILIRTTHRVQVSNR